MLTVPRRVFWDLGAGCRMKRDGDIVGGWQLIKELAQGFSCRAPLGVSCSDYVCMVGGVSRGQTLQSPLSWPPGITWT